MLGSVELELLVAQFVEGESTLAAAPVAALGAVLVATLVAALVAVHLKGQTFLSRFHLQHPLCLSLCLKLVLLWKVPV